MFLIRYYSVREMNKLLPKILTKRRKGQEIGVEIIDFAIRY